MRRCGDSLREIRTKPEGNPKVLERTARIPKSAMKTLWIKSRGKIAGKQQESQNEPANTAGEQLLSGMETAAQKGVRLSYRGGKKLARDTARKIREKRDTGIKAEIRSAQQMGRSAGKAAKSGPKTVRSSARTAERTVKTAEQTGKSAVKTAQYTAKTARQTAQAAVKTAKIAVPAVKAAAKAAAAGAKAAVKTAAAAIQAAAGAIKSAAAAIAAGGWIAVLAVTVACCAGMLLLLLLGGQQPRTSWEGTGIFDWPLPGDFSITSPFGERGDPFTGELSFHDGVDIAAPEGTAILTAADGVVTAANRTDPWGGSYGYYVRIRHDETYETLYAHCAEVLVRAGQEVRQGEIIALVGSTGNSTGSHLHFEVREGRDKVDAMTFFQKKPLPENTSP